MLNITAKNASMSRKVIARKGLDSPHDLIRSRRQRSVSVSFLGLMIALLGAPQALAGSENQEICHNPGNGPPQLLTLPAEAITSHLGHGDTPPITYYMDSDGDGVGSAWDQIAACSQPFGYAEEPLDCDDQDSSVWPGAIDACGDGVDQDCDSVDPLCSTELDGWTTTAGRVTGAITANGSVTGTFTLARLSEAEEPVRFGGACIIADLVSRGVGSASCSTDSDCAVTPASGLPKGSYGYCASPDGSGEEKRCWTRLGGPQLPLKPGDPGYDPLNTDPCIRGPQVPGTQNIPAVSAFYTPDDGSPIRWLVLTCLASEANPLACAQADAANYVRSVGPVTTWEW